MLREAALAFYTAVGKRPIRLRREVLGPRHPSTLISMNNLAFLYQRQGRLSEAEQLHQEALRLRREVLGSGDAARPLQTFTLKQFPLTHTAAPTTSGTASSLEVRVGDIAWHGADSLVDLDPADIRPWRPAAPAPSSTRSPPGRSAGSAS